MMDIQKCTESLERLAEELSFACEVVTRMTKKSRCLPLTGADWEGKHSFQFEEIVQQTKKAQYNVGEEFRSIMRLFEQMYHDGVTD